MIREAVHVWCDVTEPLTVPSPGRHALVRIATPDDGPQLPDGAFEARHSDHTITIRWADSVSVGDQYTVHPLPAPAGPVQVTVIG